MRRIWNGRAELEEFERVGPDAVIAFLAEPVVGAATGCVTAIPDISAASGDCDRHGALLILDEVMCRMGRTGTGCMPWEQEGITPDIQVIAKGLVAVISRSVGF